MTHLFEMSTTNREDAIYTKAELLIDSDGTPSHMFPDDPLADIDELREADGWMRAVSPGGRAAYEGLTPWSESAGVGVRPAEPPQQPARPIRAELPEFLALPAAEAGSAEETGGSEGDESRDSLGEESGRVEEDDE